MSDENEPVFDAGTFDRHFRDEIAAEPGGDHIRRCFSCSTCTASCPVAGVTDKYNPRRVIHMALLGMRDQVLTSDFIWLCSVCYTCYERCPQDVRIPELMNAIRNIAAREGHVPPALVRQLEELRAHGRLLEIGEYDNERRAGYGLPPVKGEEPEVRELLKRLLPDKCSDTAKSLRFPSQGAEPPRFPSQGAEPLRFPSEGAEPLRFPSEGAEPLRFPSEGVEPLCSDRQGADGS